MNKLFILAFLFTFSAAGLHRVAAQLPGAATIPEIAATPNPGEGSLVAHNAAVASSRPVSSVPLVDATIKKTAQTKVVRVYGGAGFFNLALAEKLRPRLAKGIASTKSEVVNSLPETVPVPVKAETKQVQTVSKL